ncbi:hypothetical protein E2C01_060095 [Portunus trituberculatus]|uniref:Uncharacterized protein n=1 Tax=Portunus trituberculatus TaxID=210409 RepID=A0A5B7H8D4_PORTR|nr:hypothetical protein [Portunus trituberculatus]
MGEEEEEEVEGEKDDGHEEEEEEPAANHCCVFMSRALNKGADWFWSLLTNATATTTITPQSRTWYSVVQSWFFRKFLG